MEVTENFVALINCQIVKIPHKLRLLMGCGNGSPINYVAMDYYRIFYFIMIKDYNFVAIWNVELEMVDT